MSMNTMNRIVALAACVFVGACALEDGAGPPVSGPSEFALAVTFTATPDQLPRDGSSQAVVTLTVRDVAGQPVAGQRLSLAATIGSLSEREIVTGANGLASLIFTAPPAATVGNSAVIQVTPFGTDGANATTRQFGIGLTGASNRTRPTPEFDWTPKPAEANIPVRFDASATTDEGAPCLDDCTYTWDFGDGTSATGRIVSHRFSAGRTYTVGLSVTDAAGTVASIAKAVPVSAIDAPTVSLAVAPNPPLSGQPAVFRASAVAAPGHSIVRFEWDFGDGTTQTTTSSSVSKTYESRGTYVARVTAVDDMGQTGTAALSFRILGTGVTASFTISPPSAETGQEVRFNATGSAGAGGTTIVSWEWDFGDGTSETEEEPTTSHTYATAGSYRVVLTVTDSAGSTAVSEPQTVTVADP